MSSPRDKIPARDWPIPPMDHAPGHKDTAFTWAMGRLILQRIVEGETVKAITADPRMPAYCTVFQWMKVVPEFGEAVRQVRAVLAKMRRAERDAGLAPRRRSGRRSTYTPRMGRAVCDRVRAGASVSEVAATPGLPSFKAIYNWLRREPEFRARFIEACAWRECELLARIGMTVETVTPATLAQAKAEVARLEGRIGRLTPKTYRPATWRR